MTNTNCLEGLRCPHCGQAERLRVVARVMCLVTDGGSEPFGDHDWDDDSIAACPDCEFAGPLLEFRAGPGLPPDPDGMNDERAGWAKEALAAFMAATGTDPDDAVSDLLCDLMHWCDRRGVAFRTELARAQGHYDAETLGEAE